MKAMLDQSPSARQRRSEEVDRRMAGSTAKSQDRAAERLNLAAQVEGEEIAAAQAIEERAQAAAERARIAGAYRVGSNRDRGVQALRMALTAPVSAKTVEALMAGIPADLAAAPEALVMPGAASFGTKAAQAERERIRSILSVPAAKGRMSAAAALALEGDESLSADAVAALLASMPLNALSPKAAGQQALERRSEGFAEFGGDARPHQSRSERSDQMWSKAISTANASIGIEAGSETPAQSLKGPESDPFFGMTAEGRAAAEAAMTALRR